MEALGSSVNRFQDIAIYISVTKSSLPNPDIDKRGRVCVVLLLLLLLLVLLWADITSNRLDIQKQTQMEFDIFSTRIGQDRAKKYARLAVWQPHRKNRFSVSPGCFFCISIPKQIARVPQAIASVLHMPNQNMRLFQKACAKKRL